MITPNCFIDSQLPTNRNPFPISRQSIAHQSPTGRWILGIVVADKSLIDLQPKKCSFDRTVVALFAAVF